MVGMDLDIIMEWDMFMNQSLINGSLEESVIVILVHTSIGWYYNYQIYYYMIRCFNGSWRSIVFFFGNYIIIALFIFRRALFPFNRPYLRWYEQIVLYWSPIIIIIIAIVLQSWIIVHIAIVITFICSRWLNVHRL
jgi:hypothetical protein